MPQKVSPLTVNPHLGDFLFGGIRYQVEGLSGLELLEVAISATEDRSVNRGAEASWATLGKRWTDW